MMVLLEQLCLASALVLLVLGLAGRMRPARGLVGLGLAATAWVVLRVALRFHAPFSNMYESVAFFGLLYSLKWSAASHPDRINRWLGLPGVALLLLALLLPTSYKLPQPVPAALQSFWIFIHVPAYFLGYVSLTMATVFSLYARLGRPVEPLHGRVLAELRAAYALMSIGLVSGAIWADLSWGRFWSWDPKESWALATWLLVAAALHLPKGPASAARQRPEWRLILVLAAFLAMLYTYFGVTFLSSGLHSYR